MRMLDNDGDHDVQEGDDDDDDDNDQGSDDDDDDDWRPAGDQIPGRQQVATCVTPSLISCSH